MMLGELKDQVISDNPPDVRTGQKWEAEDETDEIISSFEHGDIVCQAQTNRWGARKQ